MKCFKESRRRNQQNGPGFFPPKEVGYTLAPSPLNTRGTISGFGSQFKEMIFSPVVQVPKYPLIEEYCYLYKRSLNTSLHKKKKIVILHIHPQANKSNMVLIFSQCEDSTLGKIYPFLYDLAYMLKIDVIAYDYSGFGLSEGKPGKIYANADIEEVAVFARDCLLFRIQDIILFGHSIGSIPTLSLLSQQGWADVGGVILISPVSTFEEKNVDSYRGIMYSNCPFFIAHGMVDEVIDQKNSVVISSKLADCYVWYPKRGTHYNLLKEYRNKFYQKVKFFVGYIEQERDNREFVYNDVVVKFKRSSSSGNLLKNFEVVSNYVDEASEKKSITSSKLAFDDLSVDIQRIKTNKTKTNRDSSFSGFSVEATSAFKIEFSNPSLRSSLEISKKLTNKFKKKSSKNVLSSPKDKDPY